MSPPRGPFSRVVPGGRVTKTYGPTAASPAVDTVRYGAWRGRLISEQPRESTVYPVLLGYFDTAAEAAAALATPAEAPDAESSDR